MAASTALLCSVIFLQLDTATKRRERELHDDSMARRDSEAKELAADLMKQGAESIQLLRQILERLPMRSRSHSSSGGSRPHGAPSSIGDSPLQVRQPLLPSAASTASTTSVN